MIDYEKHDKVFKAYYSDHLEHAQNLGFETVSEAAAELYSKYQSVRKVAELMGYSRTTIDKHLKRMGVEQVGPGGYNRDIN